MEKNQIIEKVCSEWEQDRYAMYLRKSRTDMELEALGEGETLARHAHMLETLAAKHDIHPDQIDVYKELVSGESIDDRPEVQKLLSAVYQRKYKGVLVVEVERLARGNTKDQGEVAEAFQSSNTKIITPAKVYDPHNEFDQEYFEFGLFMSRREYKTIKRRMEAGKLQSVQEGNYLLPQRIFGFNIERKSKKDRILVPHPDEAPIVQMIFDWYTEEKRSTGWIARKLTEMGIPTTRKKPEWNRGTIRDMIENVHYNGKVSWGKQKTTKVFDERTGKLVKKRTNAEDYAIYEGKHDALISDEQFQKAVAISESTKTREAKNTILYNPLAGLLICCDCGRHMALYDASRYARNNYNYASRITHPRGTKCKKKSLPIEQVIDDIVDTLKAMIHDLELKMENNHDQTELIRHKAMIQSMEKELEKRKRKRKQLFDDYEDEVYTKEEFIERKQHHNQAIEELKNQIQEAMDTAPEPVDYEEKITTLHSIIDCLKDTNLGAKEKNDFLKEFISNITYDVIDYGERRGGKPILEVFMK